MNYELTNEILEMLQPYIENAKVTISTDNFVDDEYRSDLVTIGEENEISFEVFEDAIDVSYFAAIDFFGNDDLFESPEEHVDYIKAAKDFLLKLFKNRIKHTEVFKGKKRVYESYAFIYPDNSEVCIYEQKHNILLSLIPFLKKTEVVNIWEFDREEGIFVKH